MPHKAPEMDLDITYVAPQGLSAYLEGAEESTEHVGAVEKTHKGPAHLDHSQLELITPHEAEHLELLDGTLRRRLRGMAWVMWFGIILLYSLQNSWGQRVAFPGLMAGVFVIISGVLVLLYGKHYLTERQLRMLELILSTVVGVLLLALQTNWLLYAAQHAHPTLLVHIWDLVVLGFAILILSYGMFMPNGPRRTAIMVLAPIAGPVLVTAILQTHHPALENHLGWWRVCESLGILASCGGISVVASCFTSQLRQDAKRGKLLGQYRLKKLLGRGGMGEVYLAEHHLLKRPCAIKTIRSSDVSDPLALVRFEREVKALARLSHWHAVEIYDYGRTENGTFYYVMEYLPGLSLHDIVTRYGPMPPCRVIHFLEQACAALAEVHRHGLVHRDLKPANILAAYRGHEYDVTKILDFGLVQERTLLKGTPPQSEEGFVGSPAYMPPEMIRPDAVIGPASDLYSLGAVGYFLLTAHPPFVRPTLLRTLMAHARDPVVPPSAYQPHIPKDLEAIILRCLEKDPQRRFHNAQDMRRALWQCQDAGKWTTHEAENWWLLNAPECLKVDMGESEYACRSTLGALI